MPLHCRSTHSPWSLRSAFVLCLFLPALFSAPLLCQARLVAAGSQALHLLDQQAVERTFPPSVFFRGKSAPVQFRNAAAAQLPGGSLFFAGLIDNSGYASNVQETYQMYLLLEQPMQIGNKTLSAGAYGAGFVGERFVVMDIGGHTVAEGATELEERLARPRPLQLVQTPAGELRLYLGKRWVRVAAEAAR